MKTTIDITLHTSNDNNHGTPRRHHYQITTTDHNKALTTIGQFLDSLQKITAIEDPPPAAVRTEAADQPVEPPKPQDQQQTDPDPAPSTAHHEAPTPNPPRTPREPTNYAPQTLKTLLTEIFQDHPGQDLTTDRLWQTAQLRGAVSDSADPRSVVAAACSSFVTRDPHRYQRTAPSTFRYSPPQTNHEHVYKASPPLNGTTTGTCACGATKQWTTTGNTHDFPQDETARPEPAHDWTAGRPPAPIT